MKGKKAMVTAFIAIVAFSAAWHLTIFDSPARIRYSGNGLSLLCMALIGFAGYFSWRMQPVKWPAKLWLWVYLAGIFIFSAGSLIATVVFSVPLTAFEKMCHVAFFNSPVPFAILYLLASKTTGSAEGYQTTPGR